MEVSNIEGQIMARLTVHLAEIMERKGLSRMDIVRGTGVTYQTVSKWAKNQVTRLDVLTVARLAQFLEVDEDELYTIEYDD